MNAQLFRRSARLVLFFALALGFAAGAVSVANAIGPWTNGQAATLVLGQAVFTTSTTGNTASTTNGPSAVAVDPTTGKVFVTDAFNNRVLRFASGAALVNGAGAEAVLGQPDFTTITAGTTASKMSFPFGVFVDSGGRLWVGETGNNRVLRFDNAATKANGANADGVLGQADFTSSASATTQSRMNNPRNTIVDSAGQLWVADQGNNRVLRFDNAATKANGANADAVLGQADFTSSTAATTQNGMKQPGGVAVTSSGTLFVGDGDNNRVLRFDNAATKANGANADAVLGQANFTSSTAATTQNGMRSPFGVAYDSEGRLYVSDQWNHRILIFNSAATLANGAPADNVLGQTNFTTGTVNTGGMSASTLYAPIQVFADNSAGVLWAADYGNSRVLRYFSLKTNTTTTLASSQNPSAVGQQVTFTATVAPTSGSGTPTGTVVFKDGGTDITGCSAQALSGGQATCATSSLTAGTHTITADYSGDTNFNTSTGTLTGGQVVNVVSVFKYYFPLVSK
jgi:hypothetical protein